MANKVQRPLSPHLQVYRFQYTMLTSILHRITGAALTGGALLLAWWLVALAIGGDSYELVQTVIGSILGRIALFGFTVALYYHLANGIRHLIWDTGRGYDLPSAERGAYLAFFFTAAMTIVTWVAGYAAL